MCIVRVYAAPDKVRVNTARINDIEWVRLQCAVIGIYPGSMQHHTNTRCYTVIWRQRIFASKMSPGRWCCSSCRRLHSTQTHKRMRWNENTGGLVCASHFVCGFHFTFSPYCRLRKCPEMREEKEPHTHTLNRHYQRCPGLIHIFYRVYTMLV